MLTRPLPSGAKAMPRIAAGWPLRVSTSWPFLESQILMSAGAGLTLGLKTPPPQAVVALKIEGNRWTRSRFPSDKSEMELLNSGTLQIDPTKTPKTIDLMAIGPFVVRRPSPAR